MQLPPDKTVTLKWRDSEFGPTVEADCIHNGQLYRGTYVLTIHTLTYFEGSPHEPFGYAEERATANLLRYLTLQRKD